MTTCALPGFLYRLYQRRPVHSVTPPGRRKSHHTRPPWEDSLAAYGPSIERVLDIFLLCGQAIERRIEVILVKGLEPERLGHSVLGGPADRGETGPLGSDAGQDEKQDEFGSALRAEYLEQSDALRSCLSANRTAKMGPQTGCGSP